MTLSGACKGCGSEANLQPGPGGGDVSCAGLVPSLVPREIQLAQLDTTVTQGADKVQEIIYEGQTCDRNHVT